MAERKATNKYYPPDWDPSKGSINTYVGQHPLRDRAKKLHLGIMTVRFEMPFNIWCGTCKAHIAMGVRYNAEKKAIGNYFSTKIFQFRMRCHLCDGWIEIHTDPENCTYVVASGGQRKTETYEPDEDDSVIKLKDEEEAKKLALDPFYKLEHATVDKQKAEDSAPVIDRLQKMMEPLYDDFSLSQAMRKRFREEKKAIAEEEKKNALKGLPSNLKLLPPSEADAIEAKKFKTKHPAIMKADEKRSNDRLMIKSGSIFGGTATTLAGKQKQQLQMQAAIKRKRIDPSLLKKPSSSTLSSTSIFK
eukprot:Phypoly_transcript_14236.p1 GENE.Phypoly_transcript_14236~~Phypoly_transcript_14236.p1  ORF type:complete len:319 (+),score=58.63 Phypoly_transcript_14236:49-957(+)